MQAILHYLSYPFVRYALVVGVLVALCSSLFGVPLVLKRFSFISDGLSHVAFGAVALASVLRVTHSILLVLPLTTLAAIFLLQTGGGKKRVQGDAAIAMFSVGALSVGYLFMNLFSTAPNLAGDIVAVLFGSTSILTLTMTDVYVTAGLSLFVLFLYVLFYHRLFAISFDPDFSKATGLPVGPFHFFLAIVTAFLIVIGMNLVGALLLSALIVFPALAAMHLFQSFRAVSLFAALFAVTSAFVGMLLSILLASPVGATIVCFEILAYFFCVLLGKSLRQ